ncbi:MAG: N-acetyltransferase [Desulfovibrio sp.]|jgi:amino-acid N-acetyltransferase|nr:N-acetyltransferase [Desulfovibrio sp.]
MEYKLYRALVGDIKGLHSLLLAAAGSGQLLSRSLSDLYGHIRDFFVLRDREGNILGSCALSVVWEDLAEIRSLFVQHDLRGQGYGSALVNGCLDDARGLGIRRVFTLTYETIFFGKIGFSQVSKDVLPQKVWTDCIHCPKFPDCDEIAMQRNI